MREQGPVKKIISSNLAQVEIQRQGGCGKCSACKILNDGTFGLETVNNIGAKVGDMVLLEISSSNITKASALVYLLPIALLLIGYFMGERTAKYFGLDSLSELLGVLVAIIFLMMSFIFVYLFDKNIKKDIIPKPVILRVISS